MLIYIQIPSTRFTIKYGSPNAPYLCSLLTESIAYRISREMMYKHHSGLCSIFDPLGCALLGYPLCMKRLWGKRINPLYFHDLQKVSYFASSWDLMNTILAQLDWMCHVSLALGDLSTPKPIHGYACCFSTVPGLWRHRFLFWILMRCSLKRFVRLWKTF